MWYTPASSPPPSYQDLEPPAPAPTVMGLGDDEFLMAALTQIVQLLTAILAAIENR